mmetsp:Transcript_1225/g.2033  ORF Transcript_1225/g.2033 Transcript_1225/m.2033 type:complete len:203 (+) Transcript_1225:1158-1766(+)
MACIRTLVGGHLLDHRGWRRYGRAVQRQHRDHHRWNRSRSHTSRCRLLVSLLDGSLEQVRPGLGTRRVRVVALRRLLLTILRILVAGRSSVAALMELLTRTLVLALLLLALRLLLSLHVFVRMVLVLSLQTRRLRTDTVADMLRSALIWEPSRSRDSTGNVRERRTSMHRRGHLACRRPVLRSKSSHHTRHTSRRGRSRRAD